MRSYSFQYGIRGGKRAFPGFGAEQRDFNHCLPRAPACTGRKRPPISRRRKPPEGSHDHSYGHVQADKPVVVVEAYSSCDCTQVTYDRKPVQPGKKVFFTVRFSAEQPGTFFKKIAVRHSASDKPVTFAVQGIVTDE